MNKLLDRILGERLEPDEHDPKVEQARAEELERALVKHRLTLQTVQAAVSDSDRALIVALDETGAAIEQVRRGRE